jgi:hypothetical protein
MKSLRGELVGAISALLLALDLVAFKWFEAARAPAVPGVPPPTLERESAWSTLGAIRWLLVVAILAAVALPAIYGIGRQRLSSALPAIVVTVLGAVLSALLCYRVLIALPDPSRVVDQTLWGVLAVLCSLGIALGGYDATTRVRTRIGEG